MNCWSSISSPCKGMALVVVGIMLLLYTSGFLKEGLGTIIIATSIGMILYGLMLCDVHTKIKQLLKRDKV